MNAAARMTGRRRPRPARIFAFVLCASGLFAFATPARALDTNHAVSDYLPLLTLLQGELQGELTALAGRPLTWRFSLAPSGNDGGTQRQGELSVTGADFSLKIAVDYEPAAARLSWRAVEGRVDLASWLPALATLPELASTLEGISASGLVTITGAGTWTDGKATGGLRLELKDGVVRNATAGWALEGVTLRVGGDAAGLFAGDVPMELAVRTISTSRFGARSLAVSARVKDFDRIEMTSARVEAAGGELTAEPFAISIAEPVLNVKLSMREVGLEDIVALVPETLAEGRGHVNGSVRLGWSKAGGVTVGEGSISLSAGKPALVRFHPNLGLLTGSLPAAVLKHYPGLLKIETGEMPLLAAKFDVTLTPEGDANGRSASVAIEGGPVDSSLKAPLVLKVNVSGPLAPLIKLGSGVSLGAGP